MGMKRLFLIIAAMALAASACTTGSGTETTTTSTPNDGTSSTTEWTGESYAGTVEAPEFPDGLEWINVAEPLTIAGLEGKVVLLDFWTYGCINCIHIIPDLERLEAEYPEELVVIGVHSAKFPNEAETGNLKDIVQRYEIAHPVVNDEDFEVWQSWGANAWPTVALIDPVGNAVGIRAGEGVYDAVEPIIAGLVAEFDAKGALDRDPIVYALEADASPDRPLRYPGKVLAVDGTVWIADTGHHRIVEVDAASGDVTAVYGSGERGDADGTALEASFNGPQGLAVDGGTLYVADTNNHKIRTVDLASGEVSTLIGTGEQGWIEGGQFDEVSLSNPWALEVAHGFLYIANAGTHQIWAASLEEGWANPLIGSAREGTLNGGFEIAELAQPSGLALTDDNLLVFADSESSSIRLGDLLAGTTRLVVGGDASLFEFGDVDGVGNEARLQHPLGTAVAGSTVYVADTYNSKIKRIDLTESSIESWLGGEAGWADGTTPLFNEPGGLDLDGGSLYVADTNNHVIRVIDTTDGTASTLVLKGIEAYDAPAAWSGNVVALPPMTASAGPATIRLDYTLPDGYKVNDDAPSSIEVSGGASVAELTGSNPFDLTGTDLPTNVAVDLVAGEATVLFDVTIIYCESVATSLCLIDQVRYELPLTVTEGTTSTMITLQREIRAP